MFCRGRGEPGPLPVPLCVSSSDKFWYCRLSPNHKVLHYGDLEESPQGEVPHDSLQDKRKCPPAGGRGGGGVLVCFLVTKYHAEKLAIHPHKPP